MRRGDARAWTESGPLGFRRTGRRSQPRARQQLQLLSAFANARKRPPVTKQIKPAAASTMTPRHVSTLSSHQSATDFVHDDVTYAASVNCSICPRHWTARRRSLPAKAPRPVERRPMPREHRALLRWLPAPIPAHTDASPREDVCRARSASCIAANRSERCASLACGMLRAVKSFTAVSVSIVSINCCCTLGQRRCGFHELRADRQPNPTSSEAAPRPSGAANSQSSCHGSGRHGAVSRLGGTDSLDESSQ